jgi:hypothetical protein
MNSVAYFRTKGYHVGRVESFATVGTRPGRLDPASLRLEGDHHFWGSERNLGGELSGERFFDFNGLRGSKQGKVFLALLPWRSKRHNARGLQ